MSGTRDEGDDEARPSVAFAPSAGDEPATDRRHGMSRTDEVGEVSYSVRACSRCGSALTERRTALGLTRWVCEACGRRSR